MKNKDFLISNLRKQFIHNLNTEFLKLLSRPINKQWLEDVKQTLHKFQGTSATLKLPNITNLTENLSTYIKETKHPSKTKTNKIIADLKTIQQISTTIKSKEFTMPDKQTTPTEEYVLVIDDDEIFTKDFVLKLNKLGVEAISAKNINEATAIIKDTNINLIFTDIHLNKKDYNGPELIKAIGKEITLPPVVYISINDIIEHRLKAARGKGISFLKKPIEQQTLSDILDTFIVKQQSPLKALILDDDETMANFCKIILEKNNFTAKIANNPKEIFNYLEEFSPDVLLLDLYMPGCTGQEVANMIRQHQAYLTLPIIFISGEQSLNKQFELIESGGDDFLLKPYKPEHLVKVAKTRGMRFRRLQSLIQQDGLTGLAIFRKIESNIEALCDSSVRYKYPVSCALLDIDNFKNINDTYGHLVGDDVLRKLSHILSTRLRSSDIPARYGGDEFIVFLSHTSKEAAHAVIGSIQQEFNEVIHQSMDREFTVSFSTGIASYGGEGLKNFIANTDANLLSAKHDGKNRIRV